MMQFGVDYYPEHWTESQWEGDLKLMLEHGFNIVRVAEFAWSRLEPHDGEYDFAWLDRFLSLCERHGIQVMMGAPARVVPAWLFTKHPDIAILAYEGHRETFGTRYTTCISNPTLRDYAMRLTHKLGEHYKGDNRIMSWHLDNEYGDASPCYCEICRQEFIKFLQGRYVSLSELNESWGLAFWSMELTAWDQVWLPKKTNHFQHHPTLLQEFHRFVSRQTEWMIEEQARILREYDPERLITTNIQSCTRDCTDYHRSCRPLDVVSTNYYPPASYNTIDLDITRGILRKNFWSVEQKAGAPGTRYYSYYTSPPGEVRMYTWQSIAHGADMILYFRWRTPTFSNEQFYMGMLRYDGMENRVSREIAEVGKELHALWDKLGGTTVQSQIALLHSQDSVWAMKYYRPNREMNYRERLMAVHRSFERNHYATDVISPLCDLTGYRLVVAPMLYLTDEEIVERLCSYVEQGGNLVLSARSCAKDYLSRMVSAVMHSRLEKLLGIKVEELLSLIPGAQAEILMNDGSRIGVTQWAELIVPDTAEALGRYDKGWYRGYAAVTKHRYGKGAAWYIGAVLEDDCYDSLLAEIAAQSGLEPLCGGSSLIQVATRSTGDDNYTFLMNTGETSNFAQMTAPGIDLLTGQMVQGCVEMQPYEVLIIHTKQ